jgi:hypothetical protein
MNAVEQPISAEVAAALRSLLSRRHALRAEGYARVGLMPEAGVEHARAVAAKKVGE